MAGRLPISLLPARIARAVSDRVQDAVAERTAPPVVTAVRREGLTETPSRALAELHEAVGEAERHGLEGVLAVVGDAGAAVVAADARVSAREVRVYGVAPSDRADLEAALGRRGFPPSRTRITIVEDGLDLEEAPVAVGYAPDDASVSLLAPMLGAGGVLLVSDDGRPALEALVRKGSFRFSTRGGLHAARRRTALSR